VESRRRGPHRAGGIERVPAAADDQGDVAPRRRASVRRRTTPAPATAPETKSKGEGIDLLTPARARRRGV
jgi:hypothetical protein